MTKAKYYVEKKDPTSGRWWVMAIALSQSSARAFARYYPGISSNPFHVRIRHKGRTIARWQDGRRVGK